MLIDITNTIQDTKNVINMNIKPFSHVITPITIDTSNMEYAEVDDVTDEDNVKELSFRILREIINIYETPNSIILLGHGIEKVYLTNKKDTSNSPVLRYKVAALVNVVEKPLSPAILYVNVFVFVS